jgi:hypothetical protein
LLPHSLNRIVQACPVELGAAAWRRAVWMRLAEWEVTAKDGQSGFAEGSCQRHEQQGTAVGSGTVGQDESVAGGAFRHMKKAAKRWLYRCLFE